MTYLIIGLLALGLLTYFLLFRPASKSKLDGYFISTSGQSNDRVKSLDLNKPTEDASYILDTSELSFPDGKRITENTDYKADPGREWIIDVIQVNGGPFKKHDLLKLFDYDWRSKFQSGIYGFSPVDGRWTYALAGGSPDIYDKIQVGINLQDVYNAERTNYDPRQLERYIIELEKRIKQYPAKLRLAETEPVDSAISRAKKLVQLFEEFNKDAIIILQSGSEFKGIAAWDALQSVGLVWGDGDLFHWNNYDSGYGHDQHFSVWTTTNPGYFLPEEIKQEKMNPSDLVFGFSIPRSADPEHIFDIMLKAVKYCQKRLGGHILDKNGQPFNEVKEKTELIELLTKMKEKDIIPGSDKALMTY